MTQRVIAVGNLLAVKIPKNIVDDLGITSETYMESEIDEDRQVITFRIVDTLPKD